MASPSPAAPCPTDADSVLQQGLLQYLWQALLQTLLDQFGHVRGGGPVELQGVSCPHRGGGFGVQRVALPPGSDQLGAVGIDAEQSTVHILIAGPRRPPGQKQAAGAD
jgi:hypothetical protein